MGHLKRLAAPAAWKIPRKEKKFVAKPSPGPHPAEKSLPLLLIVRDVLGYAKTSREAKRIINERKILVDKKVRTDYKFPVGLMDIIEIPALNEKGIVLFDGRGKLVIRKLKDAKFKLCKIVNKTIVRGGHIQLNLHDGRNILAKVKDPRSPSEDVYAANDTLMLDLENNSIKDVLHYQKGSLALITGGKHKSKIARIEEIKVLRSPEPNAVVLSSDTQKFETIDEYIFVIGEKEPAIPEIAMERAE